MNVTLVPINAANWRTYIELAVDPSQQWFVAPNVKSIAQARVEPYWEIYGICLDGEPVGFTMFGRVPELKTYWITRLMIDARHQGNGYGRAAMGLVLAELNARDDCTEVWISFVPENAAARKLYLSLGFEDLNRLEDGEVIFRRAMGQVREKSQ